MRSSKDDRRVKYTKMVLRESFIKLLDQKDISQITIKEICEEADVNRATFYAHYSDQYDLMHKIESELFENITSYLSGFPQETTGVDIIEMVERIFEYIRENAKLCKLLLSEKGDLNFQKKIMTLVYDENITQITASSHVTLEEAECIHAFTITGCVGVIQKWLDSDMKASDRAMAELLVKLSMRLATAYSE